MKVVFLHGIGDGDPNREWLATLNAALTAAGHPAIDESQVIAPRYDSFLATDGISAKMPDVTYKPKDDRQSRQEFERRQASVNRSLQHEPEAAIFGFHAIPAGLMAGAHGFGVDHLSVMNLNQVRRYVTTEGLRGAILRHILGQLPTSGDILLIAHSLGSVIAIDLVDHLPEKLKVRRFITLGSPANSEALHRGSERLLKKVPYSHIDDWTNVFSVGDIVTMGRGIASMFPGAQDVGISLGPGVHGTDRYLAHPVVVKLVADILYPSKKVVRGSTEITRRLTDEQFFILVKCHFAAAVAKHIKDAQRAQQYSDALNLIQDDLAAQLDQMTQLGHALPPEMHTLISGQLPPLPERLELSEAVAMLTALTATNFIEPYEIDTGEAPKAAVADMLDLLGFKRNNDVHIVKALTEVDDLLKRTGGIPWGRIGLAAAGLALVAAGPIGLMAAAPASAFGAAAITGGLAAFGPGGMVGGLATLGALAASGAGVAGAALGASRAETLTLNVTQLSLRVATDYALKLLGLPASNELWGQLVAMENQIAAELNRTQVFSDPKSVRIQQLRAALDAVTKLLAFVTDKGIGGANALGAAP
ncbi:MAG: hypothetical protein E6R06_30645 [Mycobacterium sp.]|nr:MAG: hypothetical protein E6R06_30645 [Mycobacterium sp.]